MFEYYDLIGTTGVILIVVTYFLLQTGRMRSNSLMYSASNASAPQPA